MILRFTTISPSDLLYSVCKSCNAHTVHGFVSQLKWLPGDTPATLRPVAWCSGCLLPWDAEFPIEEVPSLS